MRYSTAIKKAKINTSISTLAAKTVTGLLVLMICMGNLAFAADADHPKVRLETNFGDIDLELDRTNAPKSVANFMAYVEQGFYDNTIFHRVINGFMVQGGGFTPDYEKKNTNAPVENEANNMLKNKTGTIAMARTNAPHSATAQFFINIADNGFLDYTASTMRGWGYAVFGKVTSGMAIVNKIKGLPTGPGGPFRKDAPQSPVIIMKAYEITDAPQTMTKP